MTERFGADLLKDLRGLGKPPSFDGNDAEYQDFRLSFRIHMSLVSSVSHELMDRCEIERNPISLEAVRALGEAHVKCCMQMYSALALTTKGSVRTLKHSRYAPDTQHRQYTLMQKIMKLWCDHSEVFESGLRSWELDVGERERASGTALADAVKYTVMMNMDLMFLGSICSWVHMQTVPLFEQLFGNGVFLHQTLEHLRPCQVRMMTTGCTSTLSRKARGKTKANTQRPERNSHKQHE